MINNDLLHTLVEIIISVLLYPHYSMNISISESTGISSNNSLKYAEDYWHSLQSFHPYFRLLDISEDVTNMLVKSTRFSRGNAPRTRDRNFTEL